ncbi:MAG: putative ATPase superfamily [Herbinix sp.]|jgi:AAA+ ATPase superfamily predicted ATPase|nr:putative ATPase superfamily [Herbinix sp.]
MFVKRAAELKLLEEQYASNGSNLVILYGRKGMGKTTLLTEFLSGKKTAYYYEGMECEDRLQLHLLAQRLRVKEQADSPLDYFHLFSEMVTDGDEKSILVLDEFHYIIKNGAGILEALRLLNNREHPIMIVICSSSIRWVENEMLNSLSDYAAYITAYMKLKDFTFVDFVNRFPGSSVETCIYINSILGGIPEYLNAWQEELSVIDNIKTILLNKNSGLIHAPQQFLKLELREPAVYNTILFYLAQGNRKLNDLHAKTGFSRAKISVYLKNLIQLDIVEKLVPLGDEGRENAQKGLYRIKDNFLSFWYRFVFPNFSELMLDRVDPVYEEKIAPYLVEYMGEYFADVCAEFLKLMNLHHRLPADFLWWDRWYGKNGTIDILSQSENKKTLIGRCLWEEEATKEQEYYRLLALSEEAKVVPDYCYLFSKKGFSEELRNLAKGRENIILIGLEDL